MKTSGVWGFVFSIMGQIRGQMKNGKNKAERRLQGTTLDTVLGCQGSACRVRKEKTQCLSGCKLDFADYGILRNFCFWTIDLPKFHQAKSLTWHQMRVFQGRYHHILSYTQHREHLQINRIASMPPTPVATTANTARDRSTHISQIHHFSTSLQH